MGCGWYSGRISCSMDRGFKPQSGRKIFLLPRLPPAAAGARGRQKAPSAKNPPPGKQKGHPQKNSLLARNLPKATERDKLG